MNRNALWEENECNDGKPRARQGSMRCTHYYPSVPCSGEITVRKRMHLHAQNVGPHLAAITDGNETSQEDARNSILSPSISFIQVSWTPYVKYIHFFDKKNAKIYAYLCPFGKSSCLLRSAVINLSNLVWLKSFFFPLQDHVIAHVIGSELIEIFPIVHCHLRQYFKMATPI